MKLTRVVTLAGVVVSLASSSLPGRAAAPPFTVVMSGLDNPRGLAFGEKGALYVAEAGRGGSAPCIVTPPPRNEEVCFGATGAVSRLRKGRQERVVTGLPSAAPPGGQGATGPQDVLPLQKSVLVTVGLGTDPALRAALGSDAFASLVSARLKDGSWRKVADIGDHEEAENPDGGPHDTNPYGLLQHREARILTDAGGNALLRVSEGEVSTLAVFPSRPQGRGTDAVPTSVARGPDGALYVSELTGAPFTVGAARIYRLVRGAAPEVYLDGFTAIIDIAWGPDGNLYVLQFATGPGLSGPGALIRVGRDGSRRILASEGLVAPTSFVIAPEKDKAGGDDRDDDGDDDDGDDGDGGDDDDRDDHRPEWRRPMTFYVSNCGACSPGGHVVRIDQ
jgi:hypothetical protein